MQFLVLLVTFLALSQAQTTIQRCDSGTPAGLYSTADFDSGSNATCNNFSNACTIGSVVPLVNAGDTMTAQFFYVYPFVAPTDPANQCANAFFGCPNYPEGVVNPNPIANTPTRARATHLNDGESLYFHFASPVGVIGFDYAVNYQTTFSVTFASSTAGLLTSTATYNFTTPASPIAGFNKLFLEVSQVGTPLHGATFTDVRITAQPVAPTPTIGRWLVIDNLVYGRTGYGCCGFSDRTSALVIDLRGLPAATTSVAISGDGVNSNYNQTNGRVAENGVGNQIVIFCVNPGNPVVTIYDNQVRYDSIVDGGVITCGASHVSTPQPLSTCFLDPRANYTLPTACFPIAPLDPTVQFGAALYWQNTPNTLDIRFRDDFRFTVANWEDPTFVVLAVNGIYGTVSALQTQNNAITSIADAKGIPQNCRHSSTVLIQPCLVVRSYDLTNYINFRLTCNEIPAAGDASIIPFPNTTVGGHVDVGLWFPLIVGNPNTPLRWLFLNEQNQDFRVCIPQFGNYSYNATEHNVDLGFGPNFIFDAVTTNTASANCIPAPGTQCNGSPQNLVSVLQEPLVCGDYNGCDLIPETHLATNTGYDIALTQGNLTFRAYKNWSPYIRNRVCVLNLRAVGITAEVLTVDTTLGKNLTSLFDCTAGAASPGNCTQISGPTRFFSLLEVDALKLPTNIHFDISLSTTTLEGGELVCSTATLASGYFCNKGNQVLHVCVPAVGMDVELTPCGKPIRGMELILTAEECPLVPSTVVGAPPLVPSSSFDVCNELSTSHNNDCTLYSSKCIQKQVHLDCRLSFGEANSLCVAKLAQELSVWDLLALPMGASVDLLPPVPAYQNIQTVNTPVRTILQQGACPQSYWVLCAEALRVKITENSVFVISNNINCSSEKTCNYNDFLSSVDLSDALRFQGMVRLNNVQVTISGTSRSYQLGKDCPTCLKSKISLLKQATPYSLTYTWLNNGYTRTITTSCGIGAGCQKTCSPLDCIIRWFAVNATCPVASDYHFHTDFDGTILNDHDVHPESFKFHTNPWGAVTATIGDFHLCSTTHRPCYIQNVSAPIANYDIYFVLAASTAPTIPVVYTPPPGWTAIEISINQGCAKEQWYVECPVLFNVPADVIGCGTSCANNVISVNPTTYNYACRWISSFSSGGLQPTTYFTPLNDAPQFGGIGTSAFSCPPPASPAGCTYGSWLALTPLTNLNVDLTCLPDGSSTLGNVIPDDGSQDNYRGANYTNFDGVLTNRRNPIDINICCGTCASSSATPITLRDACNGAVISTPCVAPVYPAGGDCANPIVLQEAGGYNNLVCGLLQRTYTLKVSVQELFRTENRKQYEEVRPLDGTFDRCQTTALNAAWDANIRLMRPTSCFSGSTTKINCATGANSTSNRVCSQNIANCNFVKKYDKGLSLNYGNSMLMIKFVYGLRFQRTYQPNFYFFLGITPSTNTKPHTLLRPNRLAVPAEFGICVVEDQWYSLIVFSAGAPTVSSRFTCANHNCGIETLINYTNFRCKLEQGPGLCLPTILNANCTSILFQNSTDSKK